MSLLGEEESRMMMLPKDEEPIGNNDGVWKSCLISELGDEMTS
jgi:hypothetical protein